MSGQGAPQAKHCQDTGENLLLVEGTDDCNSIFHLAHQKGLAGTFGIWASGSDERAIQKLSALLAGTPLPARLGIVLDCDPGTEETSGLTRRWVQLKDKLGNLRDELGNLPYVLPDSPSTSGTILPEVDGYPRLGFWLMPDNQSEGMLEDFLLRLAPEAAVAFAKECAQSAKVQEFGNFKAAHESKAVAHTYLAWQDEPGKPLGIAIKARQFDSANPFADHFIQWLRDLFQTSSLEPEEQAAQA
jgi:hypothetical protein